MRLLPRLPLLRRLAAPALLLALSACGGGGGTDDGGGGGGGSSLTGNWAGTLQVTLDGAPTTVLMTAQMVQLGSSISGSITLSEPSDPGEAANLGGSLSGDQLTLVATAVPMPTDDCHLFPITLLFTVAGDVLTLSSASGQACDGNGVGGHLPLQTVGGGSGTVLRQ